MRKSDDTYEYRNWYISKRNDTYYGREVGTDGSERKSLFTKDLEQAKAKIDQYVDILDTARQNGTFTVNDILNDWIEYCRKRGSDVRRAEARIKAMRSYFGNKDVELFAKREGYIYIQEYRDIRSKTASMQTIDRDLADLLSALNYAFDPIDKETNLPKPVVKISSAPIKIRPIGVKNRRTYLLKEEDFNKLVAECNKISEGLTLAVLIASTLATRSAAVCDATWNRYNDGVIDFNNPDLGGKRKGRAINKVPQLLIPFLEQAKRKRKTMFIVEHNGKQLSAVILWQLFNRARRNAGLYNEDVPRHERLCFHSLRHFALTRLAKAEVPIEKIAKVAGHSDYKITEKIYLHYNPKHQYEEAEVGSDLLKDIASLKAK